MSRAALRLVELVVGDHADAWRRAGFSVDADGCTQVSAVRIRFAEHNADRGIRSWGLADDAAGPADPANPTGAAGAAGSNGSAGIDGLMEELDGVVASPSREHANTTIALDHVVVTTPDVDRTVRAFVARGFEPRRERIGGSSDRPIRQVFLRAGEVVVELVGPPEVADGASRYAPAQFWGLAFTVADLDACVALLGDHCGAARDAVQPGRRIATLRHEALGISVPTAFMSSRA